MGLPKETDALCAREKIGTDWQAQLRQVVWQAPAVVMFVILGAGQALTTRASVDLDGQLPYDTAAAVSWAEILKLLFSMSWVVAFNREELSHAVPKAWMSESLQLFAVAVLFALQNELNFLIIEKLGAALFMILGNLKIVFTCVFMSVLLGKRFAYLQWLGVLLLTLSAVLVKVPIFVDMLKNGADTEHGLSILGLGLLLISTASSGLASVTNELILKRGTGDTSSDDPQMPFMLKNGVMYVWGTALNLLSWALWGKYPLSACLTGMGLYSILCLAGMGLACAVILRYLDNVVRCFSSVSQVLVTVLLSRLLPEHLREGTFDNYYVGSMVLLAVSLVVYQAHSSPNLFVYIIIASSFAITTGVMCYKLDSQ